MKTPGSIRRNSQIRVVRNEQVVHEGKIGSLKHFKDDISEAKLNTECGLGVEEFQDIQVGDKVEAYEVL